MILKIFQAGEIALRQTARPLSHEEILSENVQRLIEDMKDTMRDAPGVGLAAPQVGLAIQLAVIEDSQELIDRMPQAQATEHERSAVPFHVIVNPQLTLDNIVAEPVELYEGCLSIAGFRAVVPRARTVRVDCLDERAQPVTIHAQGWYARILQHEIDHLRGTLYIDRMYSRSFMTMENFNRYWKDIPPGGVK
jgi:peptide deformylase